MTSVTRPRWSPDDDAKLVSARKAGMKLADISALFVGRSKASCKHRLYALAQAAYAVQLRDAPTKTDASKNVDYIDIPDGLTRKEICALLGRSEVECLLRSRGYRHNDGRYYAVPNVNQVEDRIYAIRAAAPPAAPCFRCGCRVCACPARIAA